MFLNVLLLDIDVWVFALADTEYLSDPKMICSFVQIQWFQTSFVVLELFINALIKAALCGCYSTT